MTKPLADKPFGIDEEQLVEAAPLVRGLQVQRYEKLWTVVEQHVEESQAGDRMLDPRMLEIGLRILKGEESIYRLNKAAPPVEDDPDAGFSELERRGMVLESLRELEQRVNGG